MLNPRKLVLRIRSIFSWSREILFLILLNMAVLVLWYIFITRIQNIVYTGELIPANSPAWEFPLIVISTLGLSWYAWMEDTLLLGTLSLIFTDEGIEQFGWVDFIRTFIRWSDVTDIEVLGERVSIVSPHRKIHFCTEYLGDPKAVLAILQKHLRVYHPDWWSTKKTSR